MKDNFIVTDMKTKYGQRYETKELPEWVQKRVRGSKGEIVRLTGTIYAEEMPGDSVVLWSTTSHTIKPSDLK